MSPMSVAAAAVVVAIAVVDITVDFSLLDMILL
jgi:hypothetical protein